MRYCERVFIKAEARSGKSKEELLRDVIGSLKGNMWLDACEMLKELETADRKNSAIYIEALEAAENLDFGTALNILNGRGGGAL